MANLLSGGEQQMLAIGRALMTNPRLLILDEATEGLAPLIRDEIWRCLESLRAAGQAILVIDKNVDALTRIADRHTIIERGRVVWTGSSADLAGVGRHPASLSRRVSSGDARFRCKQSAQAKCLINELGRAHESRAPPRPQLSARTTTIESKR